MTWQSVVLRGLIALLGTLIFAIAFGIAVGHPEQAVITWMLSFAFAWVTWVWLPERTTSRTRWWVTKTARWAVSVIVLYLVLFLVVFALQRLIAPV